MNDKVLFSQLSQAEPNGSTWSAFGFYCFLYILAKVLQDNAVFYFQVHISVLHSDIQIADILSFFCCIFVHCIQYKIPSFTSVTPCLLTTLKYYHQIEEEKCAHHNMTIWWILDCILLSPTALLNCSSMQCSTPDHSGWGLVYRCRSVGKTDGLLGSRLVWHWHGSWFSNCDHSHLAFVPLHNQ